MEKCNRSANSKTPSLDTHTMPPLVNPPRFYSLLGSQVYWYLVCFGWGIVTHCLTLHRVNRFSPSPLATLGSRYAALPVGGRAAALEDYGLRTHSYSYVSVLCCVPRVLGGGFRFSGEALGKA